MESKNWLGKQLLWVLLLIVAFTAYRMYSRGGTDTVDIAAEQQAMQDLWYRIPTYPGTGEPKEQVTPGTNRVIIERTYAGKVDYAAVSAYYKKELPGVGWQYVGEQSKLPGFVTPIQIFQNSDFHLLVYLTEDSLRLRMTFSSDRTPLVDAPQ